MPLCLCICLFSLPGKAAPVGQSAVKLGVDVLIEKNVALLKGKRVGLITNQTGANRKLESTIDLLHKHPQVNLVALFAPEHGLYGTTSAGQGISSLHDKRTSLPVYSLYGKTRRPTPKMLRGVDVLIFDIQDIGVRWYTYISTMAYAMEEASKRGKEFIVLDRPNPLGGLKIEGPVMDPNLKSFVGLYPIPVIHGMTIGELAKLYKDEKKIQLELRVIPMEGWQRSMVWSDTGLTWIPTSPWIPTAETALVYPGMGLLGETGLVSIGIGYTLPFQIAGAPWMSSYALAKKMNGKNLPGVVFRPCSFQPFFGKFRKEDCKGIQIHVVDSHKFKPLATAMYLIESVRELYPQKFSSSFNETRRRGFDTHLGRSISSALKAGKNVESILEDWEKETEEFRKKREKYLLY